MKNREKELKTTSDAVGRLAIAIKQLGISFLIAVKGAHELSITFDELNKIINNLQEKESFMYRYYFMGIKFLPWHLDEWKSTQGTLIKSDKLEHFLLAVLGTFVLLYLTFSIPWSIGIMFTFGIGWEIFVDGRNAGQGFSWKDLLADIFGIVIGFSLWGILMLRLFAEAWH